MCNAYGLKTPLSRIIEDAGRVQLPLVFPEGRIPNLEPRDLFRPTNSAPVLRPLDAADPSAGLELVEMRWWLIPFFHRGAVKDWKAMCTNAKIETIDTAPTFREAYKRRRCLVPASHFFEWTPLDSEKPKGPKRRGRITAAGRDLFYFAGLWDTCRPTDHDGCLESVTIATCPPGEDIMPFHHRQPVILTAEEGAEWLKLDGPGKAALGPSPAETLAFEEDLAEAA